MKKLRLMTIVGTRPEIIKMSTIIKKADRYSNRVLVHTGQSYDYDLNEIFFKGLTLRTPDCYLGIVDNNIGETMGDVVLEAYNLVTEVGPDTVVVLGDTNSYLLIIVAKRLKVPIFHMEAGNRCKDESLPEEVIRRIVDITSGMDLCHLEHVRRYILRSGVEPEYTYAVGSPMAEVLSSVLPQVEASNILDKLGPGKGKYILLSARHEENIDIGQSFFSLINTVDEMTRTYDILVLYSYHPRSEKMTEKRNSKFDKRVIQHRPLGFFDCNKLQRDALYVVSDSGTVSGESAFFHFPTVSICTSTERPEAMDRGVFTIGSITSEAVCQAVKPAAAMHANGDDTCPVPAYTNSNVSIKVIKLIQSYVGIINKMVWRKS